MTPTDFSLSARRSTRIPMRIPVRLGVKQPDDSFVTLNGWTVVLNAHGAKIECPRALDVTSDVLITVPSSRSATGRVVWLDSQRNKNGNFEFALELKEAHNLWGVAFPPTDWDKRKHSNTEAVSPRSETVIGDDDAIAVIEFDPQPLSALESAAPEPQLVLPPEANATNGGAPDSSPSVVQPVATPHRVDITKDLEEAQNESGEDTPASIPVISPHMDSNTFPVATAAVLNALVTLLEKQGVLNREDLYAEMNRLS